MSDSDDPPPLLDSSSDEADYGCRRSNRHRPPSHSTDSASDSMDSAHPSARQPRPAVSPATSQLRQAADFCLSRMKQSVNLQDWDHVDFVRSINESVLFPPSSKPLAVFQEAQVDAFSSGGSQMSPLNGWAWRGRKGSGVVKGVRGLGMLQHLRDSRLIPYRLGCNCLYEHPGLKHLLVGRQGSNAPSAFPRLMHINPTMSGPVYLRRKRESEEPWGVGFAGAEFVVVSKSVVGVEEVWEVVSELIQVSIKPNGDAVSATPGLEGLSDFHSESETVKSTAFVPVTLDGKATLVEGQAPYDIDRFKAWHMSPQYHGISHHVWRLEDIRMFMYLHRLALTLWSIYYGARHLTFVRCIFGIILYVVAILMVDVSEASGRIYSYYQSGFGKVVMASIRVFFVVWVLVRDALKFTSTVARKLVARLLRLPKAVFPRRVYAIAVNVVMIVVVRACDVGKAVVQGYDGSIEAIVARLPPVPGLGRTVRFVHYIFRVLFNTCVFFFVALAALFYWWYCAEEESLLVHKETRYRDLLDQTDAQSKAELTKLIRGFVFDLRAKNEIAMDRRRRARTKGAVECSGGRRGGDHACLAALAIAAVKLERKTASEEVAAITRILVKSGTIRDSLVRTARVMLATDPAKAAAEVAHELMHAAHAGLIWPDEPLIACALRSEGRDPTAENVMWHRSKWVAVAANMIVQREALPSRRRVCWFKDLSRLPKAEASKDIDCIQRSIHPAERCVHCYSQRESNLSSSDTRNHHMKTEGRKPSSGLSACRSAVVKDSRRRKLQPHYEVEDDDCRVTFAASRDICDKPNNFPFFHAEARQPKVGADRARRLAIRLQSLNDKYEELVRLDRDMAETYASPPQPEQSAGPSAHEQGRERMANERKAAQERKARRIKARKERATEAEAARKQRLRELEDVVLAADESATAAADEEDEEDEEDDDTLCIVCMTEKKNACLVHGKTSHQVTCLACGNRLKKAKMGCPICKRRIDVVIENFTS